jgi:hypothetical protein
MHPGRRDACGYCRLLVGYNERRKNKSIEVPSAFNPTLIGDFYIHTRVYKGSCTRLVSSPVSGGLVECLNRVDVAHR